MPAPTSDSSPAPDPARVAALEALYARLPTVDCRGLCGHSCYTQLNMSVAEQARITAAGVTIPLRGEHPAGAACPALTANPVTGQGQCAVHAARPMICRLWGVTESMRCPHGCATSAVLSDTDAMDFLFQSLAVGGRDYGDVPDDMRVLLRDPQIQPLLLRWVRGDHSVAPRIQELVAQHRTRSM